jgi:hypothetical protein
MKVTEDEKILNIIAQQIDNALESAYGQKMGFFLCVTPISEGENVANYVSNMERESGINMLFETAERLKANEEIPVTEGNA